MALLGLLLVPLVVTLVVFLTTNGRVTWREALLQLGIGIAVVTGAYEVAKWGALWDTEHLNGRITGKPSGTQGCCHCRSVCDARDKNGNCTASHQVCDHFHDYWWSLSTTVGTVAVESCSGWDLPPSVWTNARVGEPASVDHGYTNYLKADPDSLFVHAAPAARAFAGRIPSYPAIHGLYRLNHVLTDGVAVPEGWVEAMSALNADVGGARQVDVTLLLTASADPSYAQAVESKWLYGPKNALTVVLGVPTNRTIAWVRVVTFSRVPALKVHLRDSLQGKALEDDVPAIIRASLSEFRRTPMADMEYLARAAVPPTPWLVGLYVLAFALSIGLSVYMTEHDVFQEDSPRWAEPRYRVRTRETRR